MKKKNLRMVVVLLLFAIIFAPIYKIEVNAATKVTKPAKVKGLKKVKMSCGKNGNTNVSSVKIKFNKVKGATGYQVLVYRTNRTNGYQTPLLYEKTTKKTTYTIKNLVPSIKYTIKVRAYKKDKSGKIVYGKMSSIKVKMSGSMGGAYFTCRTCLSVMPVNMGAEHIKSINKIYPNELHAGGTIFWK